MNKVVMHIVKDVSAQPKKDLYTVPTPLYRRHPQRMQISILIVSSLQSL